MLVTENQILNQNAHAQINNTQTNLELAKTVTTLALHVPTEKHVPVVKNQELMMIVSAQLEHTMMDLPQIAHPVYQNVMNVQMTTNVLYVKKTDLKNHQNVHAQMVNMNSKMNAKIVNSNVLLVLT